MADSMEHTIVNGPAVEAIVELVEPLLDNFPRDQVIIAGVMIAMIHMNPELTPDQLAEGVEGVTEWICTFMTSLEENVPKEKMN